MTTLKEDAMAYEPPQQTKNIAELNSVLVSEEIKTEKRYNEEYTISFVIIEGIEYRVPNSVREQFKTFLIAKPSIEKFKVIKNGEGLNTKYSVIPL